MLTPRLTARAGGEPGGGFSAGSADRSREVTRNWASSRRRGFVANRGLGSSHSHTEADARPATGHTLRRLGLKAGITFPCAFLTDDMLMQGERFEAERQSARARRESRAAVRTGSQRQRLEPNTSGRVEEPTVLQGRRN
ncbi:hypothetical protein AAFF_G00231500 [Aldrovandia affinis]|uniref:Uncharacterized protein n=1 Tax=Aldrovandia affinis TaxID=143900 RepID=A0AAD7REY3_9TELE|nr:hypothetical protein AAFF_G00231500 [Aldrovandia affinis]